MAIDATFLSGMEDYGLGPVASWVEYRLGLKNFPSPARPFSRIVVWDCGGGSFLGGATGFLGFLSGGNSMGSKGIALVAL